MLLNHQFKSKCGNTEALYYIYNLLETHSLHEQDLYKVCTHTSPYIKESLKGIVELFLTLNIIAKNEDKSFYILKNIDNKDFEVFEIHFFQILFENLNTYHYLSSFYTCDNLIFDSNLQTYMVKENLIPFEYYNLKNFLLESNFFQRYELIHNLLTINKIYLELFEKYIIDILNSTNQHTKTIEQLKDDLNKKEIQGELAEQFVVNFELKRLAIHPHKNKIKQISKEHVTAGFDIQSFNSNNSVLIDRFIEVKSFKQGIEFYWSANEVFASKNLGNKYFLYLIDSLKIHEENYIPIIIQNPYLKILNNKIDWELTVDKYHIKYKN